MKGVVAATPPAARRGEKAATAFMEKHGLDHEACSTKMRLLSLVSLAQAEKELGYAKIASALQVDVGEVELWCMRAIEAGLMVAKMDQVREVVVVTFCLRVSFRLFSVFLSLFARL